MGNLHERYPFLPKKTPDLEMRHPEELEEGTLKRIESMDTRSYAQSVVNKMVEQDRRSLEGAMNFPETSENFKERAKKSLEKLKEAQDLVNSL